MRKNLLLTGLTVLLASFISSAQGGPNLLPEGGDFEAGINGFSVMPYMLLRNADTFQRPTIDETIAAHGRCSLKLTNASGGDAWRISSRAFRPTDGGSPTPRRARRARTSG